MKTLYFECNMGAAGDMLMSSLIELHPETDAFISKLNDIGIPNVVFKKNETLKCGIKGTHIEVLVNGRCEDEHMHEEHHHHEHHHHSTMHDILHIIKDLKVTERVKNDAIAVYELIAKAESAAHGRKISEIHFHEVGTMDAVADIVGVCMLIDELKPDKIISSPIHVGSGHIHCAHGILPVPAPATAYILKNVPIYSGEIKGELTTPTGAALLKYFTNEFGNMPMMKVSKIGYGMGTKDFEQVNIVRAFLGETEEKKDSVYELCCNIDDMTGEDLSFAMNILMENGALDVFITPVGMKKGRQGVLLTCISSEGNRRKTAELIFKHTSTIGIRERVSERYVLQRHIKKVDTKFGEVRCKISEGYGVKRIKPEYDDIERIAKEYSVSIEDVRQKIKDV